MIPSFSALAPQPLTSLAFLIDAEQVDAKKIRLSKLGWWGDVFRIKGSTIPRIWSAVTFFTAWSTGVSLLQFNYNENLGISNTATGTLIVVVALCLVFRNSAAYARWELGRATLGNMTSNIRSLSRQTWINVASKPDAISPSSSQIIEADAHHRALKISALRLMVGFLIATKHHTRQQYGTDHEDLRAVLPKNFDRGEALGYGADAAEADGVKKSEEREVQVEELFRLGEVERRKRNDTSTGQEYHDAERAPLLRPRSFHRQQSSSETIILHNYLSRPSLQLPLIIVHSLALYFAKCKSDGRIESIGPAGYNALNASLNQLVADFTTIDRLATIGIPTVYGVHLKQCTSLFLLTLPFTLVEIMRWWTIPFVTVCAFMLLGIEGIASEIEMPFGEDDSDLPQDLICAEVRNEIEHMISRLDSKMNAGDWM